MPTWTKPAWYAHCWIFRLFQFDKPTTGLGVKLGMPTAQLTERGASTGVYTQSRTWFLVSHWLLWWRRQTSLRRVRTFRSRQWFRLRFFLS